MKIARHSTGRPAVVAFDHAYHGRTNLTMGLTAKNMPYKHRFGPFAGEIYRVPMAYPYRWPGGAEHCADEALATFTDQVHAQVGEDNTAAVIIEPIQGEGGFIVPPDGLPAAVWPTGAASTASCSSPTRCRPASAAPATGSPATTRASSPTSSPPPRASRAACRSRPSPGAPTSWMPSTSVASAAPTAATRSPAPRRSPRSRRWRRRTCAGRAREVEALFLPTGSAALADKYDVIGEIRGRGAMLAVELVSDPDTKTPDADLTGAVNKACHARRAW